MRALLVQTYSNLADAYVSIAERLASGGDAQSSQRAYEEAMAAYERACSLSSSEHGDDLPGLLHNWGVGLFSAGTHLQVRFTIVPEIMLLRQVLLAC